MDRENEFIDESEKAVAVLEAAIATCVKADNPDNTALKLILYSLRKAPLFFPVEIDIESMFNNIDPTTLKPGDVISPSDDVKMNILSISISEQEFIPVFTSTEEAHKGPSASLTRLYPKDFAKMIVDMKKPVAINVFSENRFMLPSELVEELFSDEQSTVYKGLHRVGI